MGLDGVAGPWCKCVFGIGGVGGGGITPPGGPY